MNPCFTQPKREPSANLSAWCQVTLSPLSKTNPHQKKLDFELGSSKWQHDKYPIYKNKVLKQVVFWEYTGVKTRKRQLLRTCPLDWKLPYTSCSLTRRVHDVCLHLMNGCDLRPMGAQLTLRTLRLVQWAPWEHPGGTLWAPSSSLASSGVIATRRQMGKMRGHGRR